MFLLMMDIMTCVKVTVNMKYEFTANVIEKQLFITKNIALDHLLRFIFF